MFIYKLLTLQYSGNTVSKELQLLLFGQGGWTLLEIQFRDRETKSGGKNICTKLLIV